VKKVWQAARLWSLAVRRGIGAAIAEALAKAGASGNDRRHSRDLGKKPPAVLQKQAPRLALWN